MDFKKELVKALAKAGVDETLAEKILEVPPERALGDFALPCFKLAAQFKKAPAEIAKELSEKIALPKSFTRVEVKGPYLNFFVDPDAMANETVGNIIGGKGMKPGEKAKRRGKIIVEYCQANPMKAFHIGHVRNICLGESIARLFEHTGEKVIRIDYGGDVGPHVSKTIYAYRNLPHPLEPKDLEEKEKWIGGLYAAGARAVKDNPELEEKMRQMVVALESGSDGQLKADWKKLRKISVDCFKMIFSELGIKFDRIILESEVEKEGIAIAKKLQEDGVAVKDEGALLVDLTKEGLEKFLVLKSDGAALYSSKDLALAKLKKKALKADISYNVVGSEQSFYFKQLVKTIELLNARKAEYCPTVHISYELVRLEGGKMASREGNVVTYRELFDRAYEKAYSETKQRHKGWKEKKISGTARLLALAAIKFGMLGHSKDKIITFNWEKAVSLVGETGPFIMYSYARARSILRKAGKIRPAKKIAVGTEKERNLVALLGAFQPETANAAKSCEPHRIAHYLLKLASEFNSFYHEVPVLQAEKGAAESRLALVKAVAQTLLEGMGLLNIGATEEM